MNPEEMFNPITRPKHYVSETGLEAIEVIEAFAKDNPHRAMALKYLCRAGKKDDLADDLRKAIWWIEREIKQEEKTTLRYKDFEDKILKPMEEKAMADTGSAFRGGDIPPPEWTHCEGCHSQVCQMTGYCMNYVKRPH